MESKSKAGTGTEIVAVAAAAVVIASSLAVRAVPLVAVSVVGTNFSSWQAACSRARVPSLNFRDYGRPFVEASGAYLDGAGY